MGLTPPLRVLLVKTSSFGDVVHTFPALTDARAARPDLELDWAVEPAFAPVAKLHPAVRQVLPLGLRAMLRGRWRAVAAAVAAIRAERYDVVLDAQGLLKSLIVTRLSRGERHGYDRASAREGAAALFYDVRHSVPRDLHAIERLRRLFADALGYPRPTAPPRYGLDVARLSDGARERSLVLVHGASWGTKLWPAEAWRALAARASAEGWRVLVPAHGAEEAARAQVIAQGLDGVECLPPQGLDGLSSVIARSGGAISGDTGLAHLAAALDRPVVTLYGPTRPGLTGAIGRATRNLTPPAEACPHLPCLARTCRLTHEAAAPPCLVALTPETVWHAFGEIAGP